MTWEAGLAVVAVGVLLGLWVFLPGRFPRRRKESASEAHLPTSPSALPGVRAPWAAVRVELSLVGNPSFGHGAGQGVPRYFYLVRANGTTLEARLPVFWDPRPASQDPLMREAYRVRVAGRLLEAGNLHVLTERVRGLLDGLLAAGDLPQFWLVNGASAIPVYRHGGAYKALTDGPRLWGWDLADLRARYTRYLASRTSGECGPVAVVLLSPTDLDVHPPEVILVGPGLWIPAFATGERLVAFGPGEATWSVPQGPVGVLRLWELVARELTASGRLPVPSALWVTELSEACSSGLREASEPTGLVLRFTRFTGEGVGRVLLPVRRLGHLYFASCQEDDCLHVAPDPWTLRESISAHLTETGMVAGIADVVVEEAGRPAFARGPEEVFRRLHLATRSP